MIALKDSLKEQVVTLNRYCLLLQFISNYDVCFESVQFLKRIAGPIHLFRPQVEL